MKKPKSVAKPPLKAGVLLGQNIAEQRRIKGWTQHELAEKVGIESVTLSRLETGTSMPSILRLAEIADALDVGLSDLVSGISPHASDQAQEILQCLNRLSASDRQLLLGMVKQFSARLAQK